MPSLYTDCVLAVCRGCHFVEQWVWGLMLGVVAIDISIRRHQRAGTGLWATDIDPDKNTAIARTHAHIRTNKYSSCWRPQSSSPGRLHATSPGGPQYQDTIGRRDLRWRSCHVAGVKQPLLSHSENTNHPRTLSAALSRLIFNASTTLWRFFAPRGIVEVIFAVE